MIIEPEKRADFESRVKEFLNIEAWKINPALYEDEEAIIKLADQIGWNQQSPVEKE